MKTMKSKRIGFTTRFTDEEENCVHLYPILEYEDGDTGFTFCDVGDKPFGALECGTNTREEISNFLRGSGIANGLAIIDAHVKMHKENIKMCEQRIEELRKTIEFLENLYVKEEDVLEPVESVDTFLERLNRIIRKNSSVDFQLDYWEEDEGENVFVANAPMGELFESPAFSTDFLQTMCQEEGINKVAMFVIEQTLRYKQ